MRALGISVLPRKAAVHPLIPLGDADTPLERLLKT